ALSPGAYGRYHPSPGFPQEDVAGFDEPRVYAPPGRLLLTSWGLSGNWTVAAPAAVLNEPGGRIAFHFHARDLNLVMGPSSRGAAIPFRVFLDGQLANDAHGADVEPDGIGVVSEQRTYQLIRQPRAVDDRLF